MYNIIILGFGNMGQKHYKVLKRLNYNVSLIFDNSLEDKKHLLKDFNGSLCSDINQILKYNYKNSSIIIALPTSLHKTFAIKLFKLRQPILIEKPLALNSMDCIEILKAANSLVCVGFLERFNPAIEYIKKHIQVKDILRIDFIRETSNWESSLLKEVAIHDLDLSLYLLDTYNVSLVKKREYKSKAYLLLKFTKKQTYKQACIDVYIESARNKSPLKRQMTITLRGDIKYRLDFIKQELCILRNNDLESCLKLPKQDILSLEHKAFRRLSEFGVYGNLARLEESISLLSLLED